jgi:hypothetical protein
MASKIDLISNALILIGDLPITSLTGNARAQVVANNLYENIKKAELSKFPWSFARKKFVVTADSVAPVGSEWKKKYTLPSDLLFLIKINPNIPYRVYGNEIYTNYEESITVDYIHNVSEALFPESFAKVMEYALAKDFALSIRDSATTKDIMASEYLNQSRMARFTDSQQQPVTPIQSRPFIDVRN